MPRRLPACAGLLLFCASAFSAEPLHERIDRAIAASNPGFDKIAAPVADDAEFLRRIYLDLAGTIPTSAEARAFLKDQASDKRRQLVERLLASPEFARRMATHLDVLLMERRPDKHVPHAAWHEYLRSSLAENKPWDLLVREVLVADGADPKTRPAAKFYLDREGEPNLITRDVSRLFLGINLQCAQCHDHPRIDDFKQDHYYGLMAFFNRSFLFTDKSKQAVYAEKAEGEVTYQSVFDPNKLTKQTKPRLFGMEAIQEPSFDKGKEYDVAPAAGVKPVPKFSRRSQLAPKLASAENKQFARAGANRFWAFLMGRGLIHPLDLDHTLNPPSHPELLETLTEEFIASKFDVRFLLREIALSKTYQRGSESLAGVEVFPRQFAVSPLRPLSPEQLAWELMQATGLTDAERKAMGKAASEAALYGKLAGNVGPFVTTFGSQPGQAEGQHFQATLDQTLFLANGPLVRGWLAPRAGNLVDRLMPLTDNAAIAEELYLSVLTRMPAKDEVRDVAEYLKGRADRNAALGELAWALVASAEFRFNH